MPTKVICNRPKLLVWDIDGTLLANKGVGKRSMSEAFERCFGIANAFETVDLAGAVDTDVFEACFEANGIDRTRMPTFLGVFYETLEARWDNREATLLPGVVDALAWSSECGYTNVIGTGNMRQSAQMKLRKFGLERWFVGGGYADDCAHRPTVVKTAIEKGALAAKRTFQTEDIWIIGDTPWDIAAGVQNRCKTVAVATGGFSAEQLSNYSPDVLLETLEQLPAMLAKM